MRIEEAADLLIAARKPGQRLAALPDGLRPGSWPEAYAIQDAVARRLGGPAGWKVGSVTPESEPFRGALAAGSITEGPARLKAADFNVIGVEAELVYRFVRGLPPREQPYGADEVLAAVGSIHAAIEIVDTRFKVWGEADRLSQVADQMNHGALIVGTGLGPGDWTRVDPVNEPVRLRIDGDVAVEAVGGNSAGDPVRMLVWLANGGAHGLGGLKAGDVVTTGSCTGTVFVSAGARVTSEFPQVGRAGLELLD